GIELVLQKGAVLGGRVLQATGEPLPNGTVRTMKTPFEDRGLRLAIPVGPPAWTDASGNFRIADLPPGDYYLAASPAQARSAQTPPSGSLPVVTTYFPAATTIDGAHLVTAAAGKV